MLELQIFTAITAENLLSGRDLDETKSSLGRPAFTAQPRYDEEERPHHYSMSESRAPELGINSWLEDELYQQYLNDRKNVDDSWKEVFETNGSASDKPAAPPPNGSHSPQQQTVALQNGGSTGSGSTPGSTLPVPEHHP